MTTSKNFSRLAHVAGMLAAGAIVLATANVASAGNIGELPAKSASGSVHDIRPILSPGQKPTPGFVNVIHPIIVGKHDHDHGWHRHDRDRDRADRHGKRRNGPELAAGNGKPVVTPVLH